MARFPAPAVGQTVTTDLTWSLDGTTITSPGATLKLISDTEFTLTFTNVDPADGPNGTRDGLWAIYYDSAVPAGTPNGTVFGNTANVNGTQVSDNTTYLDEFEGQANGPGYGGFSVKKTLSGTNSEIAADDSFVVNAAWTQAGAPKTAQLTVKGDGTVASWNDIPTGTEVTLTEGTGGSHPGVASYTPQFQPGDHVVVSADGRSAVVTIQEQTVVALTLNNEITPEKPAIDIEKVDAAGNDADTAGEAVDLTATQGSTGLVFTITNTGTEALKNLVVKDVLTRNGTIENLACVFPGFDHLGGGQ